MIDFQPLKDFLDGYLPMLGIPGSDTAIAIGGKVVFRYRAGFDDVKFHTPVREDALYNIYSCTKISTSIAALQLLERGEITLEDPVAAYYPAFRDVQVKYPDGSIRPAKNTMTIRNLLNMTAGFNYNVDTPQFAAAKAATGGKFPTQTIADVLAATPLDFEPGEKYSYSLALDLVGALVELVSGVKFGDYLRENIFLPLGMNDTAIGCPAEKLARMAKQYTWDETAGAPREIPATENHLKFGTEYESGGAGVVSSVEDGLKLAEALTHMGKGATGARILAPETVDLMRYAYPKGKLYDEVSGMFSHMRGFGYGLAVRTAVDPMAGGALCTKGTFGWDGARLCISSSDPERQISYFHAEHMGQFHAVVIPRLRNVIYSCIGRGD